ESAYDTTAQRTELSSRDTDSFHSTTSCARDQLWKSNPSFAGRPLLRGGWLDRLQQSPLRPQLAPVRFCMGAWPGLVSSTPSFYRARSLCATACSPIRKRLFQTVVLGEQAVAHSPAHRVTRSEERYG